jgi:hypothetical protein
MIFKNHRGKEIKVAKANKYKIDWDSGCRSKIQKQVKDILYKYWKGDLVYEEFPVAGTRLTLDFYNASCNIAIEVDGMQHYQYNEFFHNKNRNNFLEQLKRDDFKESFCSTNSITLYRIREDKNVQEQINNLKL